MEQRYEQLETEKRNERTEHIDECTTLEILELINVEDGKVAKAVEKALPQIVDAVEVICSRFEKGGHLIYIGAGTSGRLGILDAAECIPTFGVSPEIVQGYIAGGDRALRTPVEGCEDDGSLGRRIIIEHQIGSNDTVVGISASGSARFVIEALQEAKDRNAATVAVVNASNSPLAAEADVSIEVITGSEVISGSTRMKAGTAQKLVLNMLSTASMIKMGKVYGNLMVDLKATNRKLRARARRIFCAVTGENETEAERFLDLAEGDTKLAILMAVSGYDRQAAQSALDGCNGFLGKALQAIHKERECE